MASSTSTFSELSPENSHQLANNVAHNTMSMYYSSRERPARRTEGYCIPIEPENRRTDSPYGGVTGRLLEVPTKDPRSPRAVWNENTSDDGSPVILKKAMNSNGGLGPQQHPARPQWQAKTTLEQLHDVQAALPKTGLMQGQAGIPTGPKEGCRVRNQATVTAKPVGDVSEFGSQDEPVGAIHHPFSEASFPPLPCALTSTSRSNHFTNTARNNAPVQHTSGAASSSRGSAGNKNPSPEDTNFLITTLNRHVQASEGSMTSLARVQQGRPGEHILRVHPQTGDLYACIPFNPYTPNSDGQQHSYNLQSYDSFVPGSREAKNPIQDAADNHSLKTCNHCNIPTSILNNDSLCPFHAYYIATGAFLSYYEFCALVEMEKAGMSIASGWWTVKDMVSFVDTLKERIEKWIFVNDSTPIPKESWDSEKSPFGAIGEPVPLAVRGKTAFAVGMEQRMEEAAGLRPRPVIPERDWVPPAQSEGAWGSPVHYVQRASVPVFQTEPATSGEMPSGFLGTTMAMAMSPQVGTGQRHDKTLSNARPWMRRWRPWMRM